MKKFLVGMVMGTMITGSLTSAYAYYKERMYGYKGYVQNELVQGTTIDGELTFVDVDLTCFNVKLDKSRKRFYLSDCI